MSLTKATLRDGARVHVTTAIIIATATPSSAESSSDRYDVPSRAMSSIVVRCSKLVAQAAHSAAKSQPPASDAPLATIGSFT